MSLIQYVDTELNQIIKQIEQLLIKELDTDSDNICFYNENIKVNYITTNDLKSYISPLDIHNIVSIDENTLGYNILLEHIPTGMLIDYYIYYTNTIDYPSFKFIDNKKVHRILRIFKDNFTEDYIFIENNPKLFNLLNNLTFKALMYQDFKELLENKNEN